MSNDLIQRIDIVGTDQASASIRAVEASILSLVRTVTRAEGALGKALGDGLAKKIEALKPAIREIGDGFAASTAKAEAGLRRDIAAVVELRDAIKNAVAAQAGLAKAAVGTRAATANAGPADVNAVQKGATARLKAVRDTGRAERIASDRRIRDVARLWRIRETSERAEHSASDRRIRDLARVWRIRETSERSELAHVAKVRREREADRRHAMRAGRHAIGHAAHAARHLSHPYWDSPAFAAEAGAAFGLEAGKKIVESTLDIDTAAARFRMLAVPDGADATKETAKARHQALIDSIDLGTSAATILDTIVKSTRDGVPGAIASTLPKSIAAASQVMGGDPEKLTDSLAEGLQEAFAMKWLKTPQDARRFLNIEAGLSNYAGNSAEKSEQFIAAGGLGHGKEMGLDLEKTMAFGAMLNASGARTGQATARFMGQLSQNVPKMFDRWRASIQSHRPSEENRAVRSAPMKLGYGSIREMQAKIMAGPEGLVDFATRLETLDDKARKLVLQGYGFSEQGGAMLAELGAGGGIKAKAILARAHELAEQKEATDYLSSKFSEWQTSLAFMLKQIEAGWRAIESEIGDVLKVDILAPLRDWWVIVSAEIVNSGMKAQVHDAIIGFVHGLGFADVRAALDAMTADVRGFDFAGFAKGLGKGIRAVVDDLKALFAPIDYLAGSGDAETIGKFSAELFGFSLAAHAVSPAIAILGSISSAFLALKEAVTGVSIASRLLGITSALDALGAAAGVGVAAGAIIPVSIAAVAVGALAVTVINISEIVQGVKDIFGSWFGGGTSNDFNRFILDKARQSAGSDPSAQRDWIKKNRPRDYGNIYNADGTPKDLSDKPSQPDTISPQTDRWLKQRGGVFSPGFHPSSFDGGDQGSGGMLQKVSYQPSDSADMVLDSMTGTERGVWEVKDSVDRLGVQMKQSALDGVGSGDIDNRGGEAGAPNMRYGKGSGGQYRGTPGGGGGGPTVSGGSGGSRSWRNNNPGNIEYGPYAKSMGATGSDGRFAVFPSYDSGRKAQEHLLFESKAYKDLTLGQAIGKWAPGSENNVPAYIAAMGGNPNTKMADFSPAQRGKLLDAMQAHEGWKVGTKKNSDVSGTVGFNGVGGGNAGGAVDKAMSMMGMGEGEAARTLKHYMHSGEWCADFVNGALESAGVKGTNSAMANSFSSWGHHVGFGDVKKGDVIEESAHGRGVNHAGLATGNVQRDKNGNVTAVEMVSGNYGNMVRKNWERVGIIADLRRSNQAVEAAARKVIDTTKPADLSSKVPTHERPVPGQGAGSSGGRMVTADSSVTNHNTFHVHGARDPHAVAQTVVDHLDPARSKSIDWTV